MEKWAVFILESLSTNLEDQLRCTTEFVAKALKDSFSVLIAFITAKHMPVFILKVQKLDVNGNSERTFHIRCNE